MTIGKHICKTLKMIRHQVAQANDIPYEPTECHHQGDCSGTCPKCEQEVRYIEDQLVLRQTFGKAVTVVGVCAGLAALTSCHKGIFGPSTTSGYMMPIEETETENPPLTGIPPSPEKIKEGADSTRTESEPKTMVVKTDTLKEDLVFGDMPETQPAFPGGQRALLDYINQNIHYPPEAVKDSVKGRVVVKFTIKEDGSIDKASVVKALHPLLDKEAVRVIESMPKWIPGKRNGRAIQVNYNIPVTFVFPYKSSH